MSKYMILGKTFDLQIKEMPDKAFIGECDALKRVITVEKTLDKMTFDETLGHEVCHAIMSICGARNVFTDEQQEMICDMAGLVYSTMRSNIKKLDE
jgi:hypothetical protein